jgi:hypothetical protein
MPKDAKKNVDRYKIRGGDLNEFEFSQNQARVKESIDLGKGTAAKTAKTATKAKKAAKPIKGATAKKLAAKKAAKK